MPELVPEHPPSPEAIRLGHEPSAVPIRGYLVFQIAFVLGLFMVLLSVWGLLKVFARSEQRAGPTVSALRRAAPQPPPPLLQPSPAQGNSPRRPEQSLDDQRKYEDAILSSYGVVDQANGIYRIPIDRAMDLVLERKMLPTQANPGGGGGR